MNPYAAYREMAHVATPRIDLLLSLFDGALERIDAAMIDVKAGRTAAARPRIARAQLIVSELAASVRPEINPETNITILRLYEFVVNQLAEPSTPNLTSARNVLATLREGFQAIRPEAIEMERAGHLPPAEALTAVSALA